MKMFELSKKTRFIRSNDIKVKKLQHQNLKKFGRKLPNFSLAFIIQKQARSWYGSATASSHDRISKYQAFSLEQSMQSSTCTSGNYIETK